MTILICVKYVLKPSFNFASLFLLVKAGTYFYHGHYGMQRSAGLYGSLIVDVAEGAKEPFHYDGEFNILLSDWWHKSVHEQEVDLSSKPLRWIGDPQVKKLKLYAHILPPSEIKCPHY